MKTRIAAIVLGVLILGVLTVVGCTTRPGATLASSPAPQLGVVTDEKLRVIETVPGSAVATAGLQVGDVLLDLTWIPSDAPAYIPEWPDVINLGAATVPADGEAVVDDAAGNVFVSPILPDSVPAIPPPVESYIDKGIIPFTETERIIVLASYGVPLKLRLMRGDQVLELTVVPTVLSPLPFLAPGEVRPTPTPLPPAYYYY